MLSTAFKEAKQRIDLRREVVKDLGEPCRRGGSAWMYHCPNPAHQDRTPSFAVFKDSYRCFGACGIHGDVIDWLVEFRHMTKKEALTYAGVNDHDLVAKYEPTAPVEPKPFKVEEHTWHGTHIVAHAYETGRQRAIKYFGQYGISPEAVDYFRLGYLNGGYTIPRYVYTTSGPVLVGMKYRRDDGRGLHGLKYWAERGSMTAGLFNGWMLSLPDGSRTQIPVERVFVTEDEKTCMMLCSMGYMAVAYRKMDGWHEFLDCVFSNVGAVIIVADNDAPGHNYAHGIQEALKGHPSMIIECENHKQYSDMAKKEGVEAVKKEIEKYAN